MNPKEQVHKELEELLERLGKLKDFKKSEDYKNLSDISKELLIRQEYLMEQYSIVLKERLEVWE